MSREGAVTPLQVSLLVGWRNQITFRCVILGRIEGRKWLIRPLYADDSEVILTDLDVDGGFFEGEQLNLATKILERIHVEVPKHCAGLDFTGKTIEESIGQIVKYLAKM